MKTIKFRCYTEDSDETAAFALWEAALGSVWPLSRETFHRITVASGVYRRGDHLVACEGERIVGFVGTQTRGFPKTDRLRGELMLVMVEPARRRQGIGRALLERALDRLRKNGVSEVHLGSGGVAYFWAGVPVNLPDARAFFDACGWPYIEQSCDLVRSLAGYETPSVVHERVHAQGIRITAARPEDREAILAFEEANFPAWRVHIEKPMKTGEDADILLAWDPAGAILGTTMVMDPKSAWRRGAFTWERLLGENSGGVGPLGVAESMQGRGIGLALAAKVTEGLRDRGVATSYIGYTWLVDWYGRLGYWVWRDYRMSRRSL